MRDFTLSTKSLLPAFALIVAAGFTSTIGYAQETKTVTKKVMVKEDHEVQKTKTIEVEEINGEKVVTVTTVSDGEKTIMKFKGEEADKFLEEQHEQMHMQVHKMSLEEMENMEFDIEVEGMEEGDMKKIIIVSDGNETHSHSGKHETIVWTGKDSEEHHINIEDMNINVTDGEDGEPMKIQMTYTDENGKKVDKVMVVDKTEMAETMEDVEEILEDMNINIDLDIDKDDADSKNVKTVVVKKKIIISEDDKVFIEDTDSKMFSTFSISPNPSNGRVQLEFETAKKGDVNILVTGVEGNELFKDSFNGKGNYSKSIELNDYHGVVIVKITQGNEVEVRKLIIE